MKEVTSVLEFANAAAIVKKELKIVSHYICTELTLEATEKRLKELKEEKQ